MYTDDAMISYSSKTLDELHMVLNAEFVDIEKWLQGNKLSLNVVKTQVMIIGSMQSVNKTAVQPSLLVFCVGGTDIDLMNKVKYLDLHIDVVLPPNAKLRIQKGKFLVQSAFSNIAKTFYHWKLLRTFIVVL